MSSGSQKSGRIFWLDFIKVVAMASILTIHFNAEVSYMFTLPHKVFPNHIFHGVYLGDFGVILFFVASGAAFQLSARKALSPQEYYRRRAKAIYPMYWIAWLGAYCVNAVLSKAPAVGSLPSLLITLCGLDGYRFALWGPIGFYILGEWFLGCILLIYLVAPFLSRLFEKAPLLTLLGSCVLSVLCDLPMLPSVFRSGIWFMARIPEFVLGMLLMRLAQKHKEQDNFYQLAFIVGAVGMAAAYFLNRRGVFQYRYSIAITCFCFVLLMGIGAFLERWDAHGVVSWFSGFFFPVFLVHHWLITSIVKIVDTSGFGMTQLYLLFAFYLVVTFAAAYGLKKVTKAVMEKAQALR